MAKINLIMMLLPFVFMVHDYEEIIMFRRWIDRNREELKERFPKIESFLLDKDLSIIPLRPLPLVLLTSSYLFLLFRLLVNAYRTVDCISKVCAGYHYKPPNIALLHLFFC